MPRLNVNINDETASALKDLAKEEGVSYTEVVRRALSAYKFLNDEVTGDVSLQLVNKKSNERTTVALVK